ncbi:MAG: type II toxin-antitoxin system RelE/ParE family toxin [Mesorhizobium sp.]|nr:type II toxin-antitoxin system RelE/ParE family toxin [Mesorhizobium sp.]MBN9241440.1 type II toxin-antitoxin system RelE/ParE family toxin [Mesorhizobium sp.]
MKRYFIQPNASARLEEIYRFTLQRFGEAQADRYLDGAFALFEDITAKRIVWRRIPREFGVNGFFARYRSHFVFWKLRSDGQIAIVAILHQRMDLALRLQEDASEP